MKLSVPRLAVHPRFKTFLFAVMALGVLAFALGLWLAPQRAWTSFLISLFYVTGLGLGAAFFLASQYVTGAGWSVAIRRIPEAMTSILPFAGIGALALAFGLHQLYAWSRGTGSGHDAILAEKSAWLNAPFFMIRVAVYFLIWIVLSRRLVRSSRKQDLDGDVVHTQRNVRNSVLLLVLGVITACLASFDLLMSLEARWYSTIFGLLTLAGMFVSALASIAVFVVVLRRLGWGRLFTDRHLYDLGRLLLSFSVFWVYLWTSQHMLIWYSNIPEETSYYALRHSGGWGALSLANVLLNWLIPFVLLLSRDARRSDRCIVLAAVSILIGHWLDLYLVVAPSTLVDARSGSGVGASFGPLEILPLAGALSLFVWVALRSFSRQHAVPIRDPHLVESLPELTH